MFASVLRMLAAARLGASAKRAARRALRQAALITLAVFLLCAGIVFALVSAYFGLTSVFAPVEAAGIMAGALAVPGAIILAFRSFLARRTLPRHSDAEELGLRRATASIREGAQSAAGQVGSLNMLAVALAIGLAAGRGITRT